MAVAGKQIPLPGSNSQNSLDLNILFRDEDIIHHKDPYISNANSIYKTNRIKKYIKENVSLNILGKPNDISNLVVYLASDDAKYITGSIFKVDGGQIRGY